MEIIQRLIERAKTFSSTKRMEVFLRMCLGAVRMVS